MFNFSVNFFISKHITKYSELAIVINVIVLLIISREAFTGSLALMILHFLNGWIEQATAIVASFEVGRLECRLVRRQRIFDWVVNGANFVVP